MNQGINLGRCECGFSVLANAEGKFICVKCSLKPLKGECVCCNKLTDNKCEDEFCCFTCWDLGKFSDYEEAKQINACQDPVVESVRRKLLERSHVGIKKYGVTLYNSGLSQLQILKHAQEEALDLANYFETEIQRLEKENQQSS